MLTSIMSLLAGAGAIGCLTFVIQYQRSTKGAWRKHEAGLFLIATYTNLGIIFLDLLANLVFGQWPGRDFVGVTLFVTLVALSWWPLRLLRQANGKKGGSSD